MTSFSLQGAPLFVIMLNGCRRTVDADFVTMFRAVRGNYEADYSVTYPAATGVIGCGVANDIANVSTELADLPENGNSVATEVSLTVKYGDRRTRVVGANGGEGYLVVPPHDECSYSADLTIDDVAEPGAAYNWYMDGQWVANGSTRNVWTYPEGLHTMEVRAVGQDGVVTSSGEMWVEARYDAPGCP